MRNEKVTAVPFAMETYIDTLNSCIDSKTTSQNKGILKPKYEVKF